MSHPEAADRPPDGERVTFRRSDFNLLRRAAREKWGVPDEVKTEALFQAAKILTNRDSGDREKLAAMRFLISCDRVDQLGELGLARVELMKLKLTPDDDATDRAGGLDPAAAERALRALNEQPPAPGDP